MSSFSGLSGDTVLSGSAAFAVLKQCTSFDMHGLNDAGLIRVKTGAAPEVLSTSEDFIGAVRGFGMPVNDKRSVSLSEWKPNNSEMLKIAEQKIAAELGAAHDVKPAGPKLS